MALDTAFYLVTKDIAIRSGLVDVRYRTLDNRFILDNKDLSRVRFTTDEYISGLKGVEKITEEEAITLIAQGGYKKGLPSSNMSVVQSDESIEEETRSNEDSNGEVEHVVLEDEQGNVVAETTIKSDEQPSESENKEETNEKEEEE